MRRINLAIIMILISISVFAQTKEEKKTANKAKKEARLEEEKLRTAALIGMVESKKIVLEAAMLFDKAGVSYLLSSTLNFVGFDGEKSTLI